MIEKNSIKKMSLIDLVFVITLFLMAAFFFHASYKIIFVVFFIFFFFYCSRKIGSKHLFSFQFLLLLFFSITYIVISSINKGINAETIIIYLSFPFMYLVGKTLVLNGSFSIEQLVLIVAFGFAVHGVLNFALNYKTIFSGGRIIVDIWSKEETPITNHISEFILLSSIGFAILSGAFKKNSFLSRFLLVSLLLVGLIYNILTATRTIIYVFVLTFIICLILYSLKVKKQKERKIISTIIIIIVIFSFLLLINFAGIRDRIFNSALFQRGSNLDFFGDPDDLTSRWGQDKAVLSLLLTYPFGGMKLDGNVSFVHNTWLNIAYNVGFLPSILFFIYSLTLFFDSFILFKKNPDIKKITLFFGIYFGTFVYLMIEPVCEAVPIFLTMFCFLNGATSGYKEKILKYE